MSGGRCLAMSDMGDNMHDDFDAARARSEAEGQRRSSILRQPGQEFQSSTERRPLRRPDFPAQPAQAQPEVRPAGTVVADTAAAPAMRPSAPPPPPVAAQPARQAEASVRPPAAAAAPDEVPQDAAPSDNATKPIGIVLEIAGSGSQVALDLQRLNECSEDKDPSIALSGQVGSQIKIRTKDGWLLASVRNQRQDRREGGIVANIDFLGEGDEEKLTGKIHSFRLGVTRYPIPGAMIYPATTADLRQIRSEEHTAELQSREKLVCR